MLFTCAAAHALIHSWQTFTFSSCAGVLHMKEVFNVCCFERFKEDSFISLMRETAERWLSRTDFWWWSSTTLQVEQNRRLSSAWNFPGYWLACSCGVMLNGFFFSFARNHLQSENSENAKKKVVFPNPSGCFFSFTSCHWFFFSSKHGKCGACYVKTRAQAQMASSIERLECLVKVNAFCNELVAICCENVPYFWEKNFHVFLKVWKKHFQHYAPLCVIFGIRRIMHSELYYAIFHPRIIPEALSCLVHFNLQYLLSRLK